MSVNAPLQLYHVTPVFNREAIARQGVRPEHSRGKRLVTWWVGEQRLLWAIAHCSAKFDCPVSALYVFEASIPQVWAKRTRLTAVYTVAPTVITYAGKPATSWLDSDLE